MFSDRSEEWPRYENSQDADGYRSSSSENMRSDLDYSYSETSNQMDRRSCYECKSMLTLLCSSFVSHYPIIYNVFFYHYVIIVFH